MVELWTCRDTLALAIHPLAGTVAIHAMLTVSQVSKSFAGRGKDGGQISTFDIHFFQGSASLFKT
jgi:hypothetical protein